MVIVALFGEHGFEMLDDSFVGCEGEFGRLDELHRSAIHLGPFPDEQAAEKHLLGYGFKKVELSFTASKEKYVPHYGFRKEGTTAIIRPLCAVRPPPPIP